MKRSITFATVVLGAILLVELTMTKDADAVIMLHASQCSAFPVKSATGGTFGGGSALLTDVDGSQLLSQGGTKVICPIVRVQGGSGLPAFVTIDVFKNAPDGIVAKGCQTFFGGAGGVCTPSNPNNLTGVQHLTIPEFAWSTQAYNYIHVTMGVGVNGSFNTFFGYHHNT